MSKRLWPDIKGVTACTALLLVLTPAHTVAQGGNPSREVVTRGDINCLHQDDHSFIWLCTADGIVRFDGRTQVEFARQPGLRAFARTYDGRLWVGGSSGLFEFWREAPAGTSPLIQIPGTAWPSMRCSRCRAERSP